MSTKQPVAVGDGATNVTMVVMMTGAAARDAVKRAENASILYASAPGLVGKMRTRNAIARACTCDGRALQEQSRKERLSHAHEHENPRRVQHR